MLDRNIKSLRLGIFYKVKLNNLLFQFSNLVVNSLIAKLKIVKFRIKVLIIFNTFNRF